MIQCSELYTPKKIHELGADNIIGALSNIFDTSEEEFNEVLKDIFTDQASVKALTIEYLLNRQDRYFSKLFEREYDYNYELEHGGGGGIILPALLVTSSEIANIIFTKFAKGWSKLADAVFGDYNPIENYRMVESRETDLNENTKTESSEDVTNKFRGFNNEEMTDVSKSDTSGSSTIDKTTTGAKTKNEMTRSGNIGVTTSQQMVESSYTLARKNLLDIIYRDIDTILFIDYYC
ncbi:MAG: hypothetical protein J6S85_21835 [Methanobrevibacter sp.]|nr:hypothetical protein [Methanobrevibacter sp.]